MCDFKDMNMNMMVDGVHTTVHDTARDEPIAVLSPQMTSLSPPF